LVTDTFSHLGHQISFNIKIKAKKRLSQVAYPAPAFITCIALAFLLEETQLI